MGERLRAKYGAVFLFGYTLTFMFITFGLFNLIMAIFIDDIFESSHTRKQFEIGQTTEKMRQRLELCFAKLAVHETPDARHRDSVKQTLLTKLSPEFGHRLTGEVASAEDELRETVKDTLISRDVFNLWLHDTNVTHLLNEADIDIANKFELFDVLDVDMGGTLGLDEIVNGLMRLRGPPVKA